MHSDIRSRLLEQSIAVTDSIRNARCSVSKRNCHGGVDSFALYVTVRLLQLTVDVRVVH